MVGLQALFHQQKVSELVALAAEHMKAPAAVEAHRAAVVLGHVQADRPASVRFIIEDGPAQQLDAQALAARIGVEIEQADPAVTGMRAAARVQIEQADRLLLAEIFSTARALCPLVLRRALR